jgi:hypothetical protein
VKHPTGHVVQDEVLKLKKLYKVSYESIKREVKRRPIFGDGEMKD